MRRVTALAVASLILTCAWVSGCTQGASSAALFEGPSAPPDPIDARTESARGTPPSFGSTQTQAVAPPPVSGGTLVVSHDGRTAFVADADRDQVYLVDLATGMVTTVPLQQGDEPGRLAEDAAGRVHVACRRAGVIVTIDVAGRSVVDRQPVCPSPRGMGYDPAADALYVACATGELVTLPAAGGAPTRTVAVDRDLRDVIVGASGALYVTRLKTAELLSLGQNGSVQTRRVPPTWSRAS